MSPRLQGLILGILIGCLIGFISSNYLIGQSVKTPEVKKVIVADTRNFDYRVVKLIRQVDGDTADITVSKTIDFGFTLIETKEWTFRFRLLGIDTWEANQAGGAKATREAETWTKQAIYDDVLRGQTHKTDNFGRWLIDLYRTDTGEHLSDYLRSVDAEKSS